MDNDNICTYRPVNHPNQFDYTQCGNTDAYNQSYYDEYRIRLREFLFDMAKHFLRYGNVKITSKNLPINRVTIKDFNNLPEVKVCHDNVIRNENESNTEKYIRISRLLHNNIYSVVIEKVKSYKFFKNLSNILLQTPINENSIPKLLKSSSWNATCNPQLEQGMKRARNEDADKDEHRDKRAKHEERTGGYKYIRYKIDNKY